MAATLAFTGGQAAAQQDPESDQRVVKLAATYQIQPERGQVEVSEEITVSNVKGSRRSGSRITSYFWTGHTVWVPADAENLTIEVEGNPLEYEVVDTVSGVDIIGAEYRRNLNFGQTRVIDVTYTLPTYEPGRGARRINEAFFDLELLICCNFEDVDLTVSAPAAFDVEPPSNLRFIATQVGDRQDYNFTDNEVTGQFTELIFTEWFGIDESGMETSSATVGSQSVEIVYPPDDAEWSDSTTTFVQETAEALEAMIGSPWPVDRLVFQQGVNDDFGPWGTDGPFEGPVNIPRDYADEALAATMIEAWLSDGPFDDGPVRDGLVADMASEVVRLSGGRQLEPRQPGGSGSLDQDGAFWVMRQVSDEIGYDGLGRLITMASTGESAYINADSAPASGEPTTSIAGDWRRFVDLAEHRLGADGVATVFGDHVVDDQDSELLTARGRVVGNYEALRQRTGGVVPLGIRDAMTNWEFGEAQTLIAKANQVLAERDRVIDVAEERGQEHGLELDEAWAGAESAADLDEVQASILDRESDLNRGALWRNLLLGVLGALVVGGIVAGVWFLMRGGRKKVITSVPGAAPIAGPSAPPAPPASPPPAPSAAAPPPASPPIASSAPGAPTVPAAPPNAPSSGPPPSPPPPPS